MKNITLIFLFFTFFSFSSFGHFDENPVIRIYTDNVENTFEVGEQAVFFAEVLTDFDYPSGEAELVLEAVIVGHPPIKLKTTKISETFYSFISPKLTKTDVGSRYVQIQLKIRPKKEADRIRHAIKANGELIIEEIVKRDNSTSEGMREYHQLRIDRLNFLNESLFDHLKKLLTTYGEYKELGFFVE